MSEFEFDVDTLLQELDGYTSRMPEIIPKAIKAMSKVVEDNLKKAPTPYDADNTKSTHLRQAIGRSGVRTSREGVKYQLVFVKDRGEKDRNVYKAVVGEYGRKDTLLPSGKRIPAIPRPNEPFWRTTVERSRTAAIEAGKKVFEDEMRMK